MAVGFRVGGNLLLAAALAMAFPAWSQEADREPPAGLTTFTSDRRFTEDLTAALRSGDLATALSVLESRPDIAWTAAAVRLRAELMARLGRSEEALRLLEGHLAHHGDDAVARFQVGEIHFVAERDQSAILAYRLALAGPLDPVRRQLVEGRLVALDARRRTRFSLSLSLAPDSNLNSATSASTIDLYGLPFVLSDDARRRSGVAAAIGLGVERRQPISNRYALVAGGSLALLDAPNRTFDQTQVGLFFGPEVRLAEHALVSLTATWRDIDFGGTDLETWRGVQLSGQAYGDPQTQWEGTIRIDRIDNKRSAELGGLAQGVQVSRTRFLGPSALWRTSLIVTDHDLAGSNTSFSEGQIAVGRLFSLPFAGLAYIEPYGRIRAFDERSTVFGVRREDREMGVSIRISKRDWTIRNAFPYVQAIVSHASSNVTLGRYSRQRIEFGLTRDF